MHPGCCTVRLVGCPAAALPGYLAVGVSECQVIRLLSGWWAVRLVGCRAARLLHCQAAALPSRWAVKLLHCRAAALTG